MCYRHTTEYAVSILQGQCSRHPEKLAELGYPGDKSALKDVDWFHVSSSVKEGVSYGDMRRVYVLEEFRRDVSFP